MARKSDRRPEADGKRAKTRTNAWEYPLNGLSIDTLTLSQDGDLEVEFDLPREQTTSRYVATARGSRTFDVYEDEELEEACRRLFQLVRARVMQPDPERERVHCDDCASSACCRKYNVLVTDDDIARLAKHLGLSPARMRREYTTNAVDWCGDFPAQLACDEDEVDGEEKCVFLQRDSVGRLRCTVYEHRPQICRAFDMKTCDDFVPIERVGKLSTR